MLYAIAAVGSAIWVPLFFVMLGTPDAGGSASVLLLTVGIVIGLAFHAFMYGPQAAYITEQFDLRLRYAGSSLAYTLAGSGRRCGRTADLHRAARHLRFVGTDRGLPGRLRRRDAGRSRPRSRPPVRRGGRTARAQCGGRRPDPDGDHAAVPKRFITVKGVRCSALCSLPTAGEIARRVIRTAREMGIRTVAVHSDVDADLPFVREADVAVLLGAAAPAESYRNAERILQAAKETGAEAIHPGYGFLSENADFARAVQDAGLIWVGPSPEVIETMGDKINARNLMQDAGVPVSPGTKDPITDPADAVSAAERIGFPVMIKAAAGGGGMGMSVATDSTQVAEQFERIAAFAERTFGDAARARWNASYRSPGTWRCRSSVWPTDGSLRWASGTAPCNAAIRRSRRKPPRPQSLPNCGSRCSRRRCGPARPSATATREPSNAWSIRSRRRLSSSR